MQRNISSKAESKKLPYQPPDLAQDLAEILRSLLILSHLKKLKNTHNSMPEEKDLARFAAMQGEKRMTKKQDVSHALTTFGDPASVSDIEVGDVLEVNWTGVEHQLRDAIMRIEHEGELDSERIADTIELITVALQKLAIEDADVKRRLEMYTEVGFVGTLLALTPTEIGKKIRTMIRERGDAERRQEKMRPIQETVGALRKELAEAVDEKIHVRLLGENSAYQALVALNYETPKFAKYDTITNSTR